MTKRIFCCTTACCVAVSFNSVFGQAPAKVPDHYIVELKADADPAAAASRHGLLVSFVYSAAARGYAAKIPPGLLRQVQADPDVISITPDFVVSIGAKGGKPGSGDNTPEPDPGEIVPAGVARVGSLGTGFTGAGVGIAIVDTGIDLNHPDLRVGSLSYTFYESPQDDNGHGTHVAGTAAAVAGNGGVVGVAPGATVYAVKVLDAAGSGSDAAVIAGLNWISDNAASANPAIRVVNMSLGRPGTLGDQPLLHQAVQTLVGKSISVIVAAGNTPTAEIFQRVPACYPEVMAVASTTARTGNGSKRFAGIQADTASYFTTDGSGVAISAPGEDQEDVNTGGLINSVGILSTIPGGWGRMSGTSMAAPHAAGVTALLYQQNISISPAQAREKISRGADLKSYAPLNSPTGGYSFDQVREGILSAPGALSASTSQK